MKQASGYAWMYEKVVESAKKWGSILSIIAGVLATLVGTQGLVSVFTTEGGSAFWVGVVTAVTGYIIAVVVALNNTWKLDVVLSEGLVAQVGFAHLSRGIMYQLALRPSERQDARDFVKGILNEIETMKLSSPSIDRGVKASYIRKFKDNPIYNPDEQWEDYRYQFRRGWDDTEDDDDDGDDDYDSGGDGDGGDDYDDGYDSGDNSGADDPKSPKDQGPKAGEGPWGVNRTDSGDDEALLGRIVLNSGEGGLLDRTGVWLNNSDTPPRAAIVAEVDAAAVAGVDAPSSPRYQRRKKMAPGPRRGSLTGRDSYSSGDRPPPPCQDSLNLMLAAYEDSCSHPNDP
jgi:uncharacterized membrane protein YeaQ/YmgE (transglycosylase-associated protein family)